MSETPLQPNVETKIPYDAEVLAGWQEKLVGQYVTGELGGEEVKGTVKYVAITTTFPKYIFAFVEVGQRGKIIYGLDMLAIASEKEES